MHDDLAPVGGHARGVGPEHDRQALLGDADASQAPDVVLVQRRCANLDDLPPVGGHRLGNLAQLQPREWLVLRDSGTDCCKHVDLRDGRGNRREALTRPHGIGRAPTSSHTLRWKHARDRLHRCRRQRGRHPRGAGDAGSVGRRRSRRRPLRGAQPRRHRPAERPLPGSARLTAGHPRDRGRGDGDRLRADRPTVRSRRPGLRARRRRRARRPRARARAPRDRRAGAARRARRGRGARGVRDGPRCRADPGRPPAGRAARRQRRERRRRHCGRADRGGGRSPGARDRALGRSCARLSPRSAQR